MKASRFIELVDEVIDELKAQHSKDAFVKNMEHLNVTDRKFSEWMMTYLAWSELGSEEDVKNYYWNLENEDKGVNIQQD